jgi:hypothetical protein
MNGSQHFMNGKKSPIKAVWPCEEGVWGCAAKASAALLPNTRTLAGTLAGTLAETLACYIDIFFYLC